MRIVCAYVPNGQALDSDKYQYKLAWLDAFRQWLAEQQPHYSRLAVLGDYNIAPANEDVHDPKAWEGQVLVSDAERQALRGLINLGLSDAFRLFEQAPKSFSWWDYRALGFRLNKGLRIDHILLSKDLTGQCSACEIDRVPRKWEQPSDHAPVIATLASWQQ
jgi:exodeoxyribonuclease III